MEDIKNKIKAVIFDMDGTIIDTESLWKQVIKEFLISHGVTKLTPENEQVLRSTASSGLTKTSQILKTEFNLQPSVEDLVRQAIELSEDLLKTKPINFVTGFPDFHKILQANFISTGLATNANIRSVNILTPKLNLTDFFGPHIYSIEHANNKPKPDPDIFLFAAEKLNAKPEECLIFEDSVVGFQAAKAAGIRCIAIKTNENSSSLHLVNGAIENYYQAQDVIKKIISQDSLILPKEPEIKQI